VFCRSGLATGQLLAFRELFLDVSVKLIEQTLQLGHLCPNLRQRGLWGVADPHCLCNQALQLILLAAKVTVVSATVISSCLVVSIEQFTFSETEKCP
jgi:hypothetical protein